MPSAHNFDTLDVEPNDGTIKQPEVRVESTDFGGGYKQSVSDGLNNVRRNWNPVVFQSLPIADAMAIDAFLEAREGREPFMWTPPHAVAQMQFVCKNWAMKPEVGGQT